LGLINACVSHELRNPLHSIIAQNIGKSKLYEEIDRILHSDSLDEGAKARLRSIIENLKEGIKIQESSANIMSFLI